MIFFPKIQSLTKTIRRAFIYLIAIMIIPTVYSIIITQVHTKRYDKIITNVSNANRINQIAKEDLPNKLWLIVCGKEDYFSVVPYEMIKNIYAGISDMQNNTASEENKAKLDVAYRTCTTLHHNVEMLENQMTAGSSVSENEILLDEIRIISSLFSDIMQDFILSEIESAATTNRFIKQASINLTILQFIIVIFSAGLCLYTSITMTNSIRDPLSDMQKFSTEIANGNLSARTSIPEISEMIPLAQNMNQMASQIDVLIKKNIEEQSNFQKAEMKALQAQITPHFLYNTFDTIIWLAEQEDTERVVKITKAFSNFLRISLSRGHEFITIEQEIEHIKNYLTIQKIRYNDILNYEFKINDNLLNYKMLKLTLQPLVENAIYHGIKNKRGRGHLTITADFENESEDRIRFTVTDDGAGFTEERLREVKDELLSSSTDSEKLTSVYGLYNVNKKLKLYYGDKTNGLEIESVYTKGSSISFVIPCEAGV
ncbi:MAG: sensor histidine kinase [Treponema sp.]|nr:sensor histidine kinase [Candidatus Treponema merdequi]